MYEDYVNVSMSIADELLAVHTPGNPRGHGKGKRKSLLSRKHGLVTIGGVGTPKRTPFRVNSVPQLSETDLGSSVDLGHDPTTVLFNESPINRPKPKSKDSSPASTGYETDISDSSSSPESGLSKDNLVKMIFQEPENDSDVSLCGSISPNMRLYVRCSADYGYGSNSSDNESVLSPQEEDCPVPRFPIDNEIFTQEYTPPGQGQASKRRKCIGLERERNQVVPQIKDNTKMCETIKNESLTHRSTVDRSDSCIIRCSKHSRNRTEGYCKMCRELVCGICLINSHKDHPIIDIDKDAVSDLRIVNEELTKASNEAHKSKNTTEMCLRNIHEQRAMLIGRIQERRDYIHAQVECWYRKMETQMDNACQEEETRLNGILDTVSTTIVENEIVQRHIEKMILSFESNSTRSDKIELTEIINPCVEITEDYNKEGSIKMSDKNAVPSNHQQKLIAMNLGNAIQFDTFGSLAVTDIPANEDALSSTNPSKIPVVSRVKHLRTFETRPTDSDMSYMATGISIGNGNDVIVSDIGMDTVKGFSNRGQQKVIYNTMPEDYPTKAVALQNGEVVVSCENGVKLFHANGELITNNIATLECPGMLAAANDNQVVVIESHQDSHSVTTLNTKTSAVVSRFSSKLPEDVTLYSHSWFTAERELESDKSDTNEEVEHLRQVAAGKYRLFYKPWYIAVNTNTGDVIVSDREDHTIKVFTRDGVLKWSAGGQGMGVGEMFNPAGVVVDKYNNVIVADSGNDRVQLFSDKGECLGVIATRGHDDIVSPTDVCVDQNGHLNVLQADGKVSRFQYMF